MFNTVNHIIRQKQFLLIFIIITIVLMLVAGFKPRGYRVFNRTELSTDGKGMRFHAPSIVYTREAWPLGRPQTTDTAFTVSMRLTPLHFCNYTIDRIISFCDTAYNENIIIGQYDHCLVIQAVTETTKRNFDCDSVFRPGKEVNISIISGIQEMKVYVDGKCKYGRQDNSIKAGDVIHPGRIVVGNSPQGNTAWEGIIRNIEIFGKELSEDELVGGQKWRSTQTLELAGDNHNRIAYYDFGKESRFRIANDFGKDKGLYVPRFFTMLKLNILSLPDIGRIWSKDSILDYSVNFIGFIPFGFLLASLVYIKRPKRKTAIAVATGFGGIFSLFIELVQVYIPTRSSEISDLFLNTLGSFFGALMIVLVFRKRPGTL